MTDKDKALKMRIHDRMSLGEITDVLKRPRSTIQYWIKDHPLTDEERHERNSKLGKKGRPKWQKTESDLYKLFGVPSDGHVKSKVAEAAILLRLSLLGFEVFGSLFDGDKTDWVVDNGQRLVKTQVKWASQGKQGAPYVSMRCANGRNKLRAYQKGEFDFLIGYHLITDKAYIWSWDDVKHIRSSVSCNGKHEERWDKIGDIV